MEAVVSRWRADEIPDLSGRRAVVTGANSGIGLQTALELARHGAAVELACRDVSRGEAARKRILEAARGASVPVRLPYLADLSSVRSFAAEVSDAALDVL